MEGITSVKYKTFFSRIKESKSRYPLLKENFITPVSPMKDYTKEFGNEEGFIDYSHS